MIQIPDVLTKKINNDFGNQFSEQFIAVLIADSKPLVLVIQLNKPPYHGGSYNPFPTYDNEPTVVAKAYKVLINLQEQCKFLEFLETHNVKNILITTAPNPGLVNEHNKWVCDLNTAKEIVFGLIDIKSKDRVIFEQTFKAMTNI